ncbi:MAG: altronate dehydratase [Spirochaetales bacterium]|nr:altronate dehydratase [Spirochaetales bacterium]
MKTVRLNDKDNVLVALTDFKKGETVGEGSLVLTGDIPAGYKIALEALPAGTSVIKYGETIGFLTEDVVPGDSVHVHNMKTGLEGKEEYRYRKVAKEVFHHSRPLPEVSLFRRKNGEAGIRNELWIVPTVGCVNGIAAEIADTFRESFDTSGVDGVHTFSHPYGCSQLGDDHERTRVLLQNIAVHPNAGGVLVLGLGCENNQIGVFRDTMPEGWDPERILFLEAQAVDDEMEKGVELLKQLYDRAAEDERTPGSLADLNIGLECGGSDAFSGITANPLIGLFSDYLTENGGTTVLTEVPEMFGAEHILLEQCADEAVFDKAVAMINGYKDYYLSHNLPVYENPSPGNKKGGITTLEDKSLGCTKKAGNSAVVDVLKIEDRVSAKGLNLLASPGNDIVATTVLGSAGCQLVLFSTGRGNPLGGFIPTMKIASNTGLMERKPHWIDFDAGRMISECVSRGELLDDLIDLVIDTVNGRPICMERWKRRDIALFKTGVTL